MKKLRLSRAVISLCVALSCITSTLTVVMAQPQPPAPAPAPAQAPVQDAIDATTARMKKMMTMTPAQIQQEVLRLHETMLRANLTRAGYNDLELQDTLWQWLMEQDTARREVRKTARKVYAGIEPLAALTDAQMEAAIDDYQGAVEDEKVRRETAIAELDKKINFTRRPKLRALLMIHGYIGDEAWFSTSSVMAGSMTISSLGMAGND